MTLATVTMLASPALAGSGRSGNFAIDLREATSLAISPIASPQTVGVPFSVTFTTKDAGGNVVPWSGMLTLSASPSSAPGSVQVTAGSGSKAVLLDTPGAGVVLSASGAGLSAASNAFTVQPAGGGCLGVWAEGAVRDGEGAPISGASVHLQSGQSCTTDGYGRCQLSAVAPGQNEAWAVVNGVESDHRPITVTCNPNNAILFEVVGSGCNPWGLTPVLLLPGVMGSTTKCVTASIYPELTRAVPGDGDFACLASPVTYKGLLDPYRRVGWRTLADALRAAHDGYRYGCTVFPVPYDWRMDVATAASTYLVPAIQRAKQKSGQDRVQIVAHSMGGLVARAYINSGSFPQPSDIDKLVTVGTPNHGSVNAYTLWEGGDPILADALVQHVSEDWLPVDFYRRTARNLYGTHYGWLDEILEVLNRDWLWDEIVDAGQYRVFKTGYQRKMKKLFSDHVPSVRSLLPSSDIGFLTGPNGSSRSLTHAGNMNTRLDGLNADLSRLQGEAGADPNKVRTKIFASDDTGTLGKLRVFENETNSAAEFYQDGRPRADDASPSPVNPWGLMIVPRYYDSTPGDGTVPADGAALGTLGITYNGRGSHSSLVKQFTPEIVSYLTGTALRAPLSELPEVIVPQLGVRVDGRAQPLLTNPAGQRLGVEPGSSVLHEEVANGAVGLGSDGSQLAIESPVDGSYGVTLAGSYAGEFQANLDYVDDAVSASAAWLGYYDGTTPFTFAFTVDSGSPERVTVALAPPPPARLQADFAAGLTHLSWEASGDPGVTEYAVYAKLETDAHLAPLGTSTVPSFATGHDWAADAGDPVRLYAVAARYASGHEGFLSSIARNDDRDHDGLVDVEETRRGTGISDPDSDDDGLSDGAEDGLGTDPLDADSDGDGYTDLIEVQHFSNPLDPGSIPQLFVGGGFETGDFSEWSATAP